MTFAFPNTDDGTVHLGCSLHYFPGGIQSGGTNPAHTALQNAQTLAVFADIVVANVLMNVQTGAITTDKYNGLADDMVVTNPSIVLAVYTKGCEISGSDAYGSFTYKNVFPTDYYSHLCPWPTGAQIAATSSAQTAQPGGVTNPSAYTDPRGWTAHGFPEQRSRDGWATLAAYNAIYGPNVLTSVYHDSVGSGVFNGSANPNCNPDGSGGYTNTTWESAMWANMSAAVRNTYNPHPGTWPVFCNSLKDGPSIQHASSGQNTINSVNGSPGLYDGGLAESWLRSNYGGVSSFKTETQWQQSVDGPIAIQTAGSYFWGVTNLCNATAGSGTCPFSTDAQRNQWRRYTLCTYLLANRGKAFYEFVDTTATKPYDEVSNNSYYLVSLGAPTESPSAVGMKHAAQAGANIYWRSFTLGRVFVNPTGSDVNWTADQDYYGVNADGTRSATKIVSSGGTLTIPANDGTIGYFAPTTPPPAPTVTLVTPAPGSTVNTNTVSLIVTAVDNQGNPCAACTVQVNGGSIQNMQQTNPVNTWTLNVTLQSGANTLSIKATDNNGNTTTITPSLTYTPVTTPLTCVFQSPSSIVASVTQLVQVLVTGGTGASPGQQTCTLSLNGGGAQAMTYNAGTGFFEKVVTLLTNLANTLSATASFGTDTPVSAQESVTVQAALTPGGWRDAWISQGQDDDI